MKQYEVFGITWFSIFTFLVDLHLLPLILKSQDTSLYSIQIWIFPTYFRSWDYNASLIFLLIVNSSSSFIYKDKIHETLTHLEVSVSLYWVQWHVWWHAGTRHGHIWRVPWNKFTSVGGHAGGSRGMFGDRTNLSLSLICVCTSD